VRAIRCQRFGPVGVMTVGHPAHPALRGWVMLAGMSAAAFVVAFVLIVVGGGVVARADWAVAPRGRAGVLERLWVILPAAFLLVLLALTAVEVWS